MLARAILIFTLPTFICSGSTLYEPQTLTYLINKDQERTSPLIKDGFLDVSLQRYNNDNKTYEIKLSYEMTLLFGNKQDGSFQIDLPEKFFSQGFKEDLREKKHIITHNIEFTHMGKEDVTLNEKTFYNCDKIRIKDLQNSIGKTFLETIQNPQEILVTTTDQLGFLGVLKADWQGSFGRYNINIGLYLDVSKELTNDSEVF